MRPSLNAREIIKQSLLLEDHLFQPTKKCADCIRKHFCMLEALAEEAVTLECPKVKNTKCPKEMKPFASTVRALHHAWAHDKTDPTLAFVVASKLRLARKKLMAEYAELPVRVLPDAEQRLIQKVLHETKARRQHM